MASPPDRGPLAAGTIVVDTSAAVAVVREEPTAAAIQHHLSNAGARSIAAPSVVELGLVLCGRLGDPGVDVLHRFLDDAEVEIVEFDERLAMIAVDAFRRYGKGRHPAGLNLGDCFTYALARSTGEPLLCTGDDFRRTDLAVIDLGAVEQI